MESMSARRAWMLAPILLLSLAGLALRLTGIGCMLPQIPEQDNCYVMQVRLVADGSHESAIQWDYSKYPHLISRLLLLAGDPDEAGGPPPRSLEEHLDLASRDSLRPRILIALIGALCVPATYALARQFLGAGWSLLAAAFLSTSLLHLSFSQQGRPHVAAAAFALMAVVAAVRVRRFGRILDYVLAGLAAALAIGTLHSGVAALLPIAAAHVLRERAAANPSSSARRGPRWRAHAKLLIPLAIAALGVWLFYPFSYNGAMPEAGPIGLEENRLRLGGHRIEWAKLNGSGTPIVIESFWSYDPLLFVLAALGVAIWIWRRLRGAGGDRPPNPALAVVLWYALPYLFAICLYSDVYERFVIPLLPFLACTAAFSARAIASGVCRLFPRARERAAAAVGTIVGLLLLALPAFASVKLAVLKARPDTATLAAQWIRAHADSERDRIFMSTRIDLPLLQDPDSLQRNVAEGIWPWVFPWMCYQEARAPRIEGEPRFQLLQLPRFQGSFWTDLKGDFAQAVRSLDARYVVCGSLYDGVAPPQYRRLYAGLCGTAVGVARFTPFIDADDTARPLLFQETPTHSRTFLGAVLASERFGPGIQIFEFPR
jgi:dolichyl-phosphate-mannose-protein mannosyltransferase